MPAIRKPRKCVVIHATSSHFNAIYRGSEAKVGDDDESNSPTPSKPYASSIEKHRKLAGEEDHKHLDAAVSTAEWNSLLIWARRERGPQWDSATRCWQVDHDSQEYYNFCADPEQSTRVNLMVREASRKDNLASSITGAAAQQRSSLHHIQQVPQYQSSIDIDDTQLSFHPSLRSRAVPSSERCGHNYQGPSLQMPRPQQMVSPLVLTSWNEAYQFPPDFAPHLRHELDQSNHQQRHHQDQYLQNYSPHISSDSISAGKIESQIAQQTAIRSKQHPPIIPFQPTRINNASDQALVVPPHQSFPTSMAWPVSDFWHSTHQFHPHFMEPLNQANVHHQQNQRATFPQSHHHEGNNREQNVKQRQTSPLEEMHRQGRYQTTYSQRPSEDQSPLTQ